MTITVFRKGVKGIFLTGETVTPPIFTGTFRAPGLASALVPTVDVARAQIYFGLQLAVSICFYDQVALDVWR